MNLPHSPYMRAIVEAQEEAQDDRTDVQKLHDACRLRVDTKARLDALAAPGVPVVDVTAFKEADQADDRALSEIAWLLEKAFGDEVDLPLLSNALKEIER